MATTGMSRVSDADLKRLLKVLHLDAIKMPITRAGLIEAAFGHIEDQLDALVGRDKGAAQAIVTTVMAERGVQRTGGAQLAHSGPTVPGTRSRHTRERVEQCVAQASRSVHLLGISGSDPLGMLQMIKAVAEGKSLDVTVIFEGRGAFEDFECPELWRRYDAGELALKSRAVIIDRETALVTSDALGGQEDDGALHLGALIQDPAYVSALLDELEALVKAGLITAR